MNSAIHTNVMRRVRVIHTLRSASVNASAAILVLALSLYLIGREVWVARVWENMPHLSHAGDSVRFFTYAFTHTHPTVQVLIVLVIFASLWLGRECLRLAAAPLHRYA